MVHTRSPQHKNTWCCYPVKRVQRNNIRYMWIKDRLANGILVCFTFFRTCWDNTAMAGSQRNLRAALGSNSCIYIYMYIYIYTPVGIVYFYVWGLSQWLWSCGLVRDAHSILHTWMFGEHHHGYEHVAWLGVPILYHIIGCSGNLTMTMNMWPSYGYPFD